MRRAPCLLLSLVLTACAAGEPAPVPVAAPSHAFTVVTANVRYGTARDGADSWPARKDALVDLLAAHQPAILGVQEALDFQVAFLEARFPGHVRIGHGRDKDHGGEHACLFVDRARFEVLASGTFWLSPTPDVAGSVGWDAALPRTCTWARLRDRATQQVFCAWNTHFDHRGAEARRQSALLLAQQMTAEGTAHLVLGDFNAGEASAPLQALRAAGLRDTYRDVHPGAQAVGTFHAFRGGLDGEKIDGVLATGAFATDDATILSQPAPGGRFVSDHHPVAATLHMAAAR